MSRSRKAVLTYRVCRPAASIGNPAKTGFVLKHEPQRRWVFEAGLRSDDFFGEFFLNSS